MDFPDEDDEFELMYGEELEVLKQIEDDDSVSSQSQAKSKRSLKFQSPSEHSQNVSRLTEDAIQTSSQLNAPFPPPKKRPADDDATETITPTKFHPAKIARIEESQTDSPPLLDSEAGRSSRELAGVSFFKKDVAISRHTRRMLEDAEEEDAALAQPQVRVWKRIPPGNFIPVTSEQSQRVYLRLRNARHLEEESYKFSSQKTCRFLAVPYEVLRQEAELEREKCLLRMAEHDVSTGDGTTQDGGTGTGAVRLPKGDMDLWVEKYKPHHYVELLSDDGTNRMLLHWLKLWDKVVFGRSSKQRPAVKKEVTKGWTPSFPKKFAIPEVGEELDANGCPTQKIALLCGPPGLGKTTLAHIIAKHAGYNVIELNASDDRSPELFRTRIEAATQMKAVLGFDPRPNCLIIDEIDGAPAFVDDEVALDNFKEPLIESTPFKVQQSTLHTHLAALSLVRRVRYHAENQHFFVVDDNKYMCFALASFPNKPTIDVMQCVKHLIADIQSLTKQAAINVLISMATGKTNATKEKGPTKKKKASGGGFLQRPIICICNDIYVPALRLLRQNAFVLTFPPTLAERLASRLCDILRKQRHMVDTALLLLLCEKAENDIRSCLSTLQFIFTRSASVRRFDIQNVSIGQKDIQKGLFSVWQGIFHLPRPKRKAIIASVHIEQKDANVEEQRSRVVEDDQSETSRCHRVLRSVQSCGEYDKVFQGLFDNYLHMKIKDTQFRTVSVGADWMQFMDLINTQIFRNQTFILMPYLPYTAVAFHLLFAATAVPKLNFPSSHFEFTSKLNLIQNHLASLRSDMAPVPRAFSNSITLVTDLLPHLVTIIQPSLRPVNTHLYSAREKDELARLVDIMIAYNLTYIQQRSVEGQYSYALEPNAEEAVSFSGLKPRLPMTYAAKQLVAREIELEKMRRTDAGKPENSSQINNRQETATAEKNPKVSEAAMLPNHRRKLEPKAIVEEEKPTVDFFGRVVKVPVRPAASSSETANSSSGSVGGNVWFHFKEGFSNAVRRPIRVGDFL